MPSRPSSLENRPTNSRRSASRPSESGQSSPSAIARWWPRPPAIVAHPDDLGYEASSAVARWLSQGQSVAHLVVARGEVGIDSMEPSEPDGCTKTRRTVPLRRGAAKLTPRQVRSIRKLYDTTQLSQTKIGERFGVSQMTVSAIVRYARWQDVA